ncbi:MAG: hypothetical protein KGJ60_08985 [Verrucomicrobiota bacterium]|nr:hypothetical protein [Verrucomicrobiota bacterium]
MKNGAHHTEWHESLWRGKAAGAGGGEWRTRPEIAAELELECRLTEALAKMPETTVASNFTARVMQAIEREESRGARGWIFILNWRVLLPRLAMVTLVIAFGGLAVHHHELDVRRAELARSVALVADARTMPSVEALKNFDAIRRMSQATPRADMELLALAPDLQ